MTSLPAPPPPPIGAPGPSAWEETAPVDPQHELIGGSPEPDDPELRDEPGPDELAAYKRRREAAPKRPQAQITERALAFMHGDITVADLDDEELRRGRFRDSNGKFRTGTASKVPRAFHQELVRRLLDRGGEKLRSNFFDAVDVIAEIMNDTENEPAVRLRAADLIMTRVAGKPVDRVEMKVEVAEWEATMKGIIRTPPPELLAGLDLGTLHGEIVSHDEGDDDDDV